MTPRQPKRDGERALSAPFRVLPSLWSRLVDAAARAGLSPSTAAQTALAAWCDREEKYLGRVTCPVCLDLLRSARAAMPYIHDGAWRKPRPEEMSPAHVIQVLVARSVVALQDMDGLVTHGHAVIEDVLAGTVTPICVMTEAALRANLKCDHGGR